MIGVSVQPEDRDIVREFFELCKTPWEFYQDGHYYEVVIGTSESVPITSALLTLVFNGTNRVFKSNQGQEAHVLATSAIICHAGRSIPIYGSTAVFQGSQTRLALESITKEPVVQTSQRDGVLVVQIGYDLFREIRHLLSTGQSRENAANATVELHIQLLRDLITRAGLPLVEVPPVPAGHAFVACLTHDVDHPLLRNHRFDHTTFGFLHRATLGSLIKFCRSRLSSGKMWRNFMAAAQLPLIQLGFVRDPWRDFDRYLSMEAGRPSTFFVIPEKDNPGRTRESSGPAMRACRYELKEIVPTLRDITAAGNGVALHGLNAWLEPEDGRKERTLLSQAMGSAPTENGVRMHWLCFDEDSPAALDAAGFNYDSSVGYNETIGFRAGTTQVYRPLGTKTLLELPLHVMDTALFYPSYLNVSEPDAYRLFVELIENFTRFGGVFTLNWHDRSIAPERLWDTFYLSLLDELQNRRAWFATAAQAVAWFQMRRSVTVDISTPNSRSLKVVGRVAIPDPSLPGLTIRIHKPHALAQANSLSTGPDTGFVDISLNDQIDTSIKL